MAFMPDLGSPLHPISSFADPKIEQTLSVIQFVRGTADVKSPSFWKNHSVVLGVVESAESNITNDFMKGSDRLVFLPWKTLAGPFDLKGHPKIHVDVWGGIWK